MNQGVKGLSGSSACRWYIDEDLPVINDFRNRLGTNFTPIDVNAAIDGGSLPARIYDAPVEMTVSELLKLDPYESGLCLFSSHAFQMFLFTFVVYVPNTE